MTPHFDSEILPHYFKKNSCIRLIITKANDAANTADSTFTDVTSECTLETISII